MLIYLQMIDLPQDKYKFEEVYITYRGLMFYVADQILHNKHDAEDAVHQAFIQIAKNIYNISAVKCPKTKHYVVTIVEHKAIDIYRKKPRLAEVELQEEIAGISVEYQGDNGVADCITRLPARYREIILLRYYHGYSTKEIAKMFHISETNANKLLQRAKNKLEKICREEGFL